jgi:predicted methyltransferase
MRRLNGRSERWLVVVVAAFIVCAPGSAGGQGQRSAGGQEPRSAGGEGQRSAGEQRSAPRSNESARKPDEVVAALQLQAGQVVVDIGAGRGLFTRRFARAVGATGRAIAVDIDPKAIENLTRDAEALKASEGLTNYEVRKVAPDDPAIPAASADVIFLSNTYHHISDRVAYFTKVRAALKPGGRLVIVDFSSGGRGGDHPKQVETELGEAGYKLVQTHTFLLPGQFFLEFVAR